jgi:hypothetical protein
MTRRMRAFESAEHEATYRATTEGLQRENHGSTSSRVEEQIVAYRASIERLKSATGKLRAEQKRLKWVLLATVVLAPLVWLASATAALLVAIGGVSMFFVGHYVVFMHLHENKLTIASARRCIDEIQSTDASGAVRSKRSARPSLKRTDAEASSVGSTSSDAIGTK